MVPAVKAIWAQISCPFPCSTLRKKRLIRSQWILGSQSQQRVNRMSQPYVIPVYCQTHSGSIRHRPVVEALQTMSSDPELFQALSLGHRCVALFRAPTKDVPVLGFAWTTDDKPLSEDWKPFHVFRSDLSMRQNASIMNSVLYVCPILLDGCYTQVEVGRADSELSQTGNGVVQWVV